MQIKIKRFHREREPQSIDMDFAVDLEDCTLLEALTHIKRSKDPSMTFASGCRSSVCGSCAVRVNGKEVLACAYKVQDGDYIEPLRYMDVLKDLVVDHAPMEAKNRAAKNSGDATASKEQSEADARQFEVQSDCILCGSCYSACPVMETKPDFLGPYALTRSWRYVTDSRQEEPKTIIDAVQTNGIWDCTLCNECVPVCPQGIAPKQDISMLQTKSGMLGYANPNFGGGMDFGGGFGTPDFGAPSF